MTTLQELPRTLGALRRSHFSEERLATRSVKDEVRENLICRLQKGQELFPGVVGYEDTVIPQIANAISRGTTSFCSGLRGQAKTRIIRLLTALLDEHLPYIEGCEIRDNPYVPICRRCRDLIALQGDDTPIDVAEPRRPLRGKTRDAGRDDRRHDRRHRSDQGGAGRPQHLATN